MMLNLHTRNHNCESDRHWAWADALLLMKQRLLLPFRGFNGFRQPCCDTHDGSPKVRPVI